MPLSPCFEEKIPSLFELPLRRNMEEVTLPIEFLTEENGLTAIAMDQIQQHKAKRPGPPQLTFKTSSTPPLSAPPVVQPFHFCPRKTLQSSYPLPQSSSHSLENPPPSPSTIAPETLTSFIQDTLSIMKAVTDHGAAIDLENDLVSRIRALVSILREEAEEQMMTADMVEEFGEAKFEAEVKREVLDFEE